MTKTFSRQYRWQLKKKAAGLCIICGKKRNRGLVYCDKHMKMANVRHWHHGKAKKLSIAKGLDNRLKPATLNK